MHGALEVVRDRGHRSRRRLPFAWLRMGFGRRVQKGLEKHLMFSTSISPSSCGCSRREHGGYRGQYTLLATAIQVTKRKLKSGIQHRLRTRSSSSCGCCRRGFVGHRNGGADGGAAGGVDRLLLVHLVWPVRWQGGCPTARQLSSRHSAQCIHLVPSQVRVRVRYS